VDPVAVQKVSEGVMPFDEPGAEPVLERALAASRLSVSTDPTVVSRAEHIIVVVGTPVDEHLNPDPKVVPAAVAALADHLREGQLIVLRSTVYPGVTAQVEKLVGALVPGVEVAFCPERIAEGKALTELFELPQIVSAREQGATQRARKLFEVLTSETVEMAPEEAELAKLFTNTYRYLKFALANQLYVMANDFGLDYERIRQGVTYNYPRAADLPAAGFAAGPCLLKDTMQLAAFTNNNFVLGHAAMMVNEGLPLYLVDRLARRYDLATLRVGILGMAFKGESDDIRSSLAYKLKRILRFKAASVLCCDPYVKVDSDLVPQDEVIEGSDLLVIGAPHRRYKDLVTEKPIVDIWGVRGQGTRV
ncbi:MAG TPA: nucleotide sugar dehydrogenase, partial [Acidimicrobiales bacterium]|nr:nucleotide sugar dehydrogenase [Acidimicrobiales bacterium]